ncbi:PREDICTED: uncharacterized protein LOC109328039 [Lupinus angustifolius]|uniref:uncharacterized protein LOC109328039 n=1 Tax=Lupinus angustifolius TaxID=3871 RepID=UPI00092F6A4F|nr:PREDICTED: uncharacterized protein LOC109328039 [Lupinus angustifolius]
MKGREAKASPSTDLLVCFPSRVHLTLMQNPICSPVRTQDHKNRHHLKKSSTTRTIGQASPLTWTNTKSEITEPTSPKVNCAGKIKVMRPKTTATKSWQSVMEEIEKLHNNNKHKKHCKLAPSLGFKKEVMHLFTCLHGMRLDLRCFGTLNPKGEDNDDIEDEGSSPVKSWLKLNAEKNNEEREVVENEHIEEGSVKEKRKSLKSLMEENRKNENLVVMRYDSDSYKISSPEIDRESKF